jgi:hypothetical protein
MAKTDPKNKAGKIGSPNPGMIHPGSTDAIVELVKPWKKETQQG